MFWDSVVNWDLINNKNTCKIGNVYCECITSVVRKILHSLRYGLLNLILQSNSKTTHFRAYVEVNISLRAGM